MRSRVVLVATAIVTIAGVGVSTAATGAIKPRPGNWAGQEANGTTPSPVSFTVGPRGAGVLNFSGEGIVKAGCTNHIQGFSAPTGPMVVTNGKFHGAETSYPQRGVRVTVTGTFVTRGKARGRIKVHFKRVTGCDASRPFTAQRTTG